MFILLTSKRLDTQHIFHVILQNLIFFYFILGNTVILRLVQPYGTKVTSSKSPRLSFTKSSSGNSGVFSDSPKTSVAFLSVRKFPHFLFYNNFITIYHTKISLSSAKTVYKSPLTGCCFYQHLPISTHFTDSRNITPSLSFSISTALNILIFSCIIHEIHYPYISGFVN